MAITANFRADFSSFLAAVDKAEVALADLNKGADKVGSSLNRMVDQFSGRKLIQDASLITIAIEKTGGVTKLTAQELQNAGAKAAEAAEKMRRLGYEVPQGIQNIADAAKRATDEERRLDELMRQATITARSHADATKNLGTEATRTKALLGSLQQQLLSMFTIGAVIAFGREVITAGDSIQKMADQTSLSTDEVQKLNYIAGQSGSSIESLVGAVQNLQQRLGDENTGAAGAMAKLGIETDAFNKLGTYQQMTTLADAIRAIKNPTEQASVAAELFGKTWKEILPAIKSGMQEVGDQAPIMAEQTVKSLDRIGDAQRRAKDQAIAWGGSTVLAIEKTGFAIGDFLSTYNPEHFGIKTSEILSALVEANDPTGLLRAMSTVKAPVLAVGEALGKLKMSAAATAIAERDLTDRAKDSIEVHKKQEEALKKLREAQERFRESVQALSFKKFFDDGLPMVGLIQDMSEQSGKFREGLYDLDATVNEFHDGITEMGDEIRIVTIPAFTKATDAVPKFKKELNDASRSVDTTRGGLDDLARALGMLSTDFTQLATIAGDSFGDIGRSVGEAIKITEMFVRQIEAMSKLTATVGSGGMSASNIAAMYAGWVGIFTAIFNMVVEMNKADVAATQLAEKNKEFKEFADHFHSASLFSTQLAENIRNTGIELQKILGPRRTAPSMAEALHLTEIIQELGGMSALTGEQVRVVQDRFKELWDLIHIGGAIGVQAIGQMDSVLADMANTAVKAGGLVDNFFLKALANARKTGIELQQVNAFIASQVKDNIVGGITAFTSVTADASTKLADLQSQLSRTHDPAEIDRLTAAIKTQQSILDALAISSQKAGDALAGSLVVAMDQMQKAGVPILEIMRQLSPSIDELGKRLEAGGFGGGAVFEEMRRMAALAKDEIAGPVISALTGLGQDLAGLHNIGLLNQDTFSGLTEQIVSGYQALDRQGKGGVTALRLLQQPLQTIWELQHRYGLEVDGTTQALLDQAEANGIVGEDHKSISEQMLDATHEIRDAVEALAHVFGVQLPSDIEKASKKLHDEAGKMQRDLDGIHAPDLEFKLHTMPDAMTSGSATTLGTQYFGSGGIASPTLAPLLTSSAMSTATLGAMRTVPMSRISDTSSGGNLSVAVILDGAVVTKAVFRNVHFNKDGAYTEARAALNLPS